MAALRALPGDVLQDHLGQQLLWVGTDMGRGAGWRQEDQQGGHVIVQVKQWWLGAQQMERSRCVPENDFGSRIHRASTGLDVGVLGGRRNEDVRLV